MPVRNARELFVMLLSVARQNTQLSSKIYKEISQQAQDPDVKEALESRTWIVEKDLSAIDRCFELMGEKPVQLSGQIQESLVEDFRKELAEIETPAAKAIFLLTKIDRFNHARVAEYEGLVETADVSGNYGVGILLECCLADKLVFIERTRRLIRNLGAAKVAARVSA
jgi:ferritin-like metal-binding protein YciE